MNAQKFAFHANMQELLLNTGGAGLSAQGGDMAITSAVPLVQSGLVIESISPVSGQVVSIEAAHDRSSGLAAAARAAAAFPAWSARPATDRADILLDIAVQLEQRRDAFISAMTEEIGTPIEWAEDNVRFASEILRHTASYADDVNHVERIESAPNIESKAVRVPCGVCLGIAPWNAPLVLGFRAIAMPLLCGNTVLLKGSEFAPRTFRLIAEVLDASHLPADVAAVVQTRAEDSEEIVEALISSPVVQRVNFTGSTRVGRRVAELCAKHLKRPLLELGGQSTMVVLDDADIDLAADMALKGAFRNQGQICMSTERLIVSHSVADALIERIEVGRRTRKPETDVGPVISLAAAERLSGMISDAVSKGAKLVGGGKLREAYVEPTLLDDVETDMRIYNEEVFGPILSITRVANDLEAITVANDSEYGLACSVFSQNIERAEKLAAQVQSGICHINRSTVNDSPHAPFGGVKSSGYGRFGGRWAIHEFTELRWVTRAVETETTNQRKWEETL
jgi:acyl-CoA reductase-like NAD-dependent aldehyde dehydrogenase